MKLAAEGSENNEDVAEEGLVDVTRRLAAEGLGIE
jgi:hypothetical protein